MKILSKGTLHSIPTSLILRTIRKANPSYVQTTVSPYHKQTNALSLERLLLLQDYTHVLYQGRSSMLRASAPS